MKLALLPGDGIGPEITTATRLVIERANEQFNLGIDLLLYDIGFAALNAEGSTLPEATFGAIAACDGIVMGPVSHNAYPPRAQGGLNPSGELRTRLDLFANIRPARSRAGIPPKAGQPLDLVVVRENTEGFYADRNLHQGPGEFMPTPDLAMSLRKVSRAASLRIARSAFDLAQQRKAVGAPGRMTAVHKRNVLHVTDGLFLECTRAVASEYPDIDYDERLVDAMAAHLVRSPGDYDVICTTNMFGDILSDLASELSGSLGLAQSLNAGERIAMAQAQHGSAPDIAGQDIANPTSLIGSVAMLLDWLSHAKGAPDFATAATAIDRSLEAALTNPETRTRDLGGATGTRAFGNIVAEGLSAV